MNALRSIASLVAAITILQLAQGLMNFQLPLAMHADGLSNIAIGFVQAMYFGGFMAGAWFGPAMLARVGHIRVFAASASIVSTTTLLLFAASDPISWGVLRGVMGGATALVFVAVDSWMSASVRKEERGGAMGIYQVLTKAALVLGPFLAHGAAMQSATPLLIAAALQSLAVVPITMTTQPQPDPPRAQPLALRNQFKVAPAAVTAVFFAGFVNSGIVSHTPAFGQELYGPAASVFFASAQLGSLLLQWPAGRLSDRVDRRLVIAGLAALSAVAALAIGFAIHLVPFAVGCLLLGLWGAGGLSFYGIATAHMADRAEPGRLAQAASGLLFVWGTGSILGPLVMGAIADALGRPAMFVFAGVAATGLAAFMLQRRGVRLPVGLGSSQSVAPQQATSIAASEIAYGDDAPEPKPGRP